MVRRLLATLLFASGAAPLAAQGAGIASRVNASATVTNELYNASGIAARRPGSVWRVSASPSLQLFGATSIGFDLLLSNEGSDVRQRLPQFGLEPRFKWGTVHLGDFSRDYGAYTLSGLRLRGAGVDITRGELRFSIQGGRSQNAIQTTANGPVYQRSVIAAAAGIGRPEGRSLELTLVRALDALKADDRPFVDTLGIDTLPTDLRPQAVTRPQSGLVAALAGTFGLFNDALRLKGELSGALLTRDRTSPLINSDSVPGGGIISGAGSEVRLSSAADLAWNTEAAYRNKRFGLRAGYEQVGAGYGSLGVAYLINDRKSWFTNGDVRLLKDHLQLQGRVQKQEDNLLGQKRFTTMRDVYQGGLVARVGRASVALTGVRNIASNDATNDTLLVDNKATVFNGQASMPWRIGKRDMVMTVGYSWQQNRDANPIRAIPAITVNTWNAALSIPIGVFTVAPSINGVLSEGGGAERQKNVVAGFRANAKLAGGKGSFGAGFNRTFVAAREVTGGTAQLSFRLPWETSLSINGRLQRYGALGTRPAFREMYLTSSLSRSF